MTEAMARSSLSSRSARRITPMRGHLDAGPVRLDRLRHASFAFFGGVSGDSGIQQSPRHHQGLLLRAGALKHRRSACVIEPAAKVEVAAQVEPRFVIAKLRKRQFSWSPH